ncbi:lysM domain receptor kinase [Trifolium repens]|nr:lysM domain receptor kinase [Trifolium repens]
MRRVVHQTCLQSEVLVLNFNSVLDILLAKSEHSFMNQHQSNYKIPIMSSYRKTNNDSKIKTKPFPGIKTRPLPWLKFTPGLYLCSNSASRLVSFATPKCP